MRLERAFGIQRGEVMSLVGAGGKTTTMFRLADELASLGWKVITTTTTMIWREERCEPIVLETDGARLLERARSALAEQGRITLASGIDETQGKLIGVEPSVIDDLSALDEFDAIIVEADGAKGRSLKAPADHEPVIPSSTSLLVPVAAIDAVGQPLDESAVHRPELVAMLSGVPLGQTIGPELISAVLLHPQGGLKNAPETARVAPLINKVDAYSIETARGLARLLLAEPRAERVALGAVAGEDPVSEVWGRVAAVVLAAGGSTRFGATKQLLEWGDKALIQHVVDKVLESSVDRVVVVLGHEAERIGSLIEDRPLQVVVNQEWARGQSSSLRAGLRALPQTCDACIFILADQPNVSPRLIDGIVERHRRTLAPIVAPVHEGQRGNPVLFARSLFGELLAMEGDQGGRGVIERHEKEMETVEALDTDPFLDIDTVEDYERAQ